MEPVRPERDAEWALSERVKELTCLYGVANVARRDGAALDEQLAAIADLLPAGWQYPEIAMARVVVDGVAHPDGPWMGTHLLAAPVRVRGQARGAVEVGYTEERPGFEEGAFLPEERSLIHEIALQVGLMLEAREAREDRERLQEQLRHADRLATIGQLAAGAAHELNEPLAGVLGFAQLIRRTPDLPLQARVDLEKIVNAALYAREVVRKLLFFARQVPTRKERMDLNATVRDGLYFLELRCERDGIRVERRLAPDLSPILADPTQVNQVLVNLVVNAIQAMPKGGVLTLTTRVDAGHVCLSVEDTGPGMDEDTRRHAFEPFYTTKPVGQGTGLGLAVAHGIVTAHGGALTVESEPGRGARFEVRLPCDAGPAGDPGVS
jgi:signal transduction histidine kinase